MIAVIMAGGSGTRFWPASRAAEPKQFLRISGDKSMLQLTFDRLEPLIPAAKIYVVTAVAQAELVRAHLPQLPVENIICEPFGMNTAPCLALSVAKLAKLYPPTECMVVLPADHVIADSVTFLRSLEQGEKVAQTGALVTFGIVPEYPATGYGYIEMGEELSPGVFHVKQFKEKPDLATATSFLQQAKFLWNSGMFCWTLDSIRSAFELHLPQALQVAEETLTLQDQGAQAIEIENTYRKMPRVPVDIAILEQAANRAVIPVSYGWSDVGSWKALADISPADDALNHFPQGGFALDSKDNYVYANKFVALIGVDNLCIVETEDALLVTTRNQSEAVKNVVEFLKNQHKEELL